MTDVAKIPADLRHLPQWCVWRYETRGGDKPTKVPYQVSGDLASSTDRATWTTFGQVIEAVGFDGIGFFFAPDDPFIGIDLDNSISDRGQLKNWARRIVDRLETYTEVSPSGTGVKLWVRARYQGDGTGKRLTYHDGKIEMYGHGRFFTVTGDPFPGTPLEISEQQAAIDWIYETILAPKPVTPPPAQRPSDDVARRCMAYLEKCPDSVSGEFGHDKALRAACECFRFGLDESDAWRVMEWFNATKCYPQWSEKQIAHKITDGKKKVMGRGEFGMHVRRIDQPRIPIEAPPKQSSGVRKLIDDTISGRRKNIEWPWPYLTRMARALLPGTITVLCGMGGSTKSLIVSQACLYWLAQDVPFAVFHLEEDREFHQLRALAQLDENSSITDDDWARKNPSNMTAAYDRHEVILDQLGQRIWDAPSADVGMSDLTGWLSDRMREGIRIAIIDPVTAANNGDRPWVEDRRFVLDSKRIMRECSGSLIVVTHPRNGDPKHGSRLDNHAGGQAYNRFTPCVLSLEAIPSETKEVFGWEGMDVFSQQRPVNRILRINKARNGPGTGHRLGCSFDANTLQMTEHGILKDD